MSSFVFLLCRFDKFPKETLYGSLARRLSVRQGEPKTRSTLLCTTGQSVEKVSFRLTRANPRRGYRTQCNWVHWKNALRSSCANELACPSFQPFRLKIHPFLRFRKHLRDFAVCGRRQWLFALDLSRFFIKKLRKKFCRQVLRQAKSTVSVLFYAQLLTFP